MKKQTNRFRAKIEKFFIFCFGLIFFGLVYSAWDDIKTTSDILTAEDWNDLVTNVKVSGGIPSGFCMFSSTVGSCPSGWYRNSSMDGRTVRGYSSPGGTGGSETHTHNEGKHFTIHDYSRQDGSAAASNWPPYMNVVICCKN